MSRYTETQLEGAVRRFMSEAGSEFQHRLWLRRQRVLEALSVMDAAPETAFTMLVSAQLEVRLLEELARDFPGFVLGLPSSEPGTDTDELTGGA